MSRASGARRDAIAAPLTRRRRRGDSVEGARPRAAPRPGPEVHGQRDESRLGKIFVCSSSAQPRFPQRGCPVARNGFAARLGPRTRRGRASARGRWKRWQRSPGASEPRRAKPAQRCMLPTVLSTSANAVAAKLLARVCTIWGTRPKTICLQPAWLRLRARKPSSVALLEAPTARRTFKRDLDAISRHVVKLERGPPRRSCINGPSIRLTPAGCLRRPRWPRRPRRRAS